MELASPTSCLVVALSERDAYTQAHCGRVETLCLQLGQKCCLSERELDLLQIAAKLHDIGKIGIPDSILLKPERLSAAEMTIMKTHAELGQNICNKIFHEEAESIGVIVLHHHEAFDGSGYPHGLAGDNIPICSRIISIVDCYDAMLTTRPYHSSRSHEEVMIMMRSECGRKTDPLLFGYFEKIITDYRTNLASDNGAHR
ncbi:HD-GYP domain-containing protein [Shewanella sp.]